MTITKAELNRVFIIGKNNIRIRGNSDNPFRAGVKIKGERGFRCELWLKFGNNPFYDNCPYLFGEHKCSCLAPCPKKEAILDITKSLGETQNGNNKS